LAKSAKKSQLQEICLPNSRNNGKIIMIQNVRAYIFESTGTNATHSFIHLFSKDPG